MQDIDTALLRTFLSLAATASFSRTAERVGRSQSAVSDQIQRLEALLGARLFDRDRRHVALTPAGEALLGPARQMIGQAEAMLARFRAPDLAGEVRFGSPEDFATHYLPEILADFAAAHPRVFLSVTCDLTLTLIGALEAGGLDLAIIKQDPRALHPGARPLWREELVWVGGPRCDRRLAFAAAAGLFPHGDAALPLVLAPPPCVYRQRATGALDAAGIPWTVAYASPSLAGAAAAVKAGLGLTVLPRTMVPAGLVSFEPRQGWPALPDAEICLLGAGGPAVTALAGFIEEKVRARA